MSKSINRFLIEKGIKSNTQKITILQMVKWVDEWQEQVKNYSIPDVSGSFSDKDLLNGYCAGALETLTNKEATFLGYDHLNKIKKEAEEWKERYTNDR